MKTAIILTLFTLGVALLTGCADAPAYTVTDTSAHVYGFWGGLWHGMVIPFSALGSLIDDNIAIYAVSNNGGWYCFGFFLGVGGLSSSTSTTTRTIRSL